MDTFFPPASLGDQQEIYTRAVRQVFQIESITAGSNNLPHKRLTLVYNPATGAPVEFLARYTGRLVGESEAAFDRLTQLLAGTQAMPIFRLENDRQVIYLISSQSIPPRGRSNPWINLLLFIMTLFSVGFTGALYSMNPAPDNPLQVFTMLMTGGWPFMMTLIANGWPFAVSLLGILAVHEFGHYIAGRLHGLDVSLPYFIPFPFSVLGTMGAFINMRSIPKNRNHLLDVGISGPLAGLVVTIGVLWLGLKTSVLSVLPVFNSVAPHALSEEGNSILYLLMKYLAFGHLLPQPTSFAGVPVLVYWVRYFFTNTPPPYGGLDVSINSVAWAGWCGLLVTSLNLIPAGQLDGGHISFILFGRKWMQRLYPFVLGATILLGFVWSGWWIWAVLLYFFGRFYAEPLDQITPLSPLRRLLAFISLGVFIVTFIPIPF